MLDLEPATRVLTDLVLGIRDDQLGAPTPCPDASLAALLDHVDALSMAFTAAGAKTPTPRASGPPPTPDAARLGQDWRARIPQRLAALADAWRDGGAWTGMTQAGGIDMPGEVAGVVALDEVVVHGWDIAVASGQPFTCEPDLLAAAYEFVQATARQSPDGTPGMFGPPVPVPDDAPLLDRLIGMAGRDPGWRAS